jgi:Sec-independent protein translocase protein TatA
MSLSFSLSFLQALGGSSWEVGVVLIAILLLFGADSLPKTLRTIGKWSEKLRRISQDLQREIRDVEEPFHQARRDWDREIRDQRFHQGSVAEDAEEVDSTPDDDREPAP